MDTQKLLEERTRLFQDAIHLRNEGRVPLLSNIWTWKFLDEGYKLSEALYDWDIVSSVVENHHRRYGFDAYNCFGVRNNMPTAKALGGGSHVINDEIDAIEVKDHCLLKAEELDEYIQDPVACMWTKVMPRVVNHPITMEALRNAVLENAAYFDFVGNIYAKMMGEYAVMPTNASEASMPFERYFNTLGGIKQTSIDVRRNLPKLKEFCDFLWENEQRPNLAAGLEMDYTGFMCCGAVGMLSHVILNRKQFEALYWPYEKEYLDMASTRDTTIFMFIEGSVLRFADYFRDYPAGMMLFEIEQDDVREMRKQLPNCAVAGGLSVDMLTNMTPQQAVKETQALIDDIGNALVLSQNKMTSFRNDCRRNNLLAVNEFVKGYRL